MAAGVEALQVAVQGEAYLAAPATRVVLVVVRIAAVGVGAGLTVVRGEAAGPIAAVGVGAGLTAEAGRLASSQNAMYNVREIVMGTKIRKDIYIEPEQDALLKRLAEDRGLSESEVIGAAIEICAQDGNKQPIDPADRAAAWSQEREFILERIKMGPVPRGRTWKREDAYDRCDYSLTNPSTGGPAIATT